MSSTVVTDERVGCDRRIEERPDNMAFVRLPISTRVESSHAPGVELADYHHRNAVAGTTVQDHGRALDRGQLTELAVARVMYPA